MAAPSPSAADRAEVDAFIDGVTNEEKRADSRRLIELMSRVTGDAPRMWGTIVGFGRYHYRYDSGREGETCLVGFSPRQAAFSIYLMGNYFPDSADEAERLRARLGKHTIGKGCLYVKRLSDVDLATLEDLVRLSVSKLREHYPDERRTPDM